tara:strand:+ start:980 stop:2884 length:1905 start_codon:yes stop_codon:yes gene_type:complete
MEKGSKITSYVKNAMESLMFGVAKSVVGSDIVAPALAPVPIDDIDASYGSVQEIEKPKEEEGKKYEEIIVERIEEVAKDKSLPYKKPEVSLKTGGIALRRTVAEIGEGGEPEAIIPLSKYKKAIEGIYREGASLLISSSIGFLQTLPASPAKGSVLAEANKIKSVFGISDTAKPAFKIGLKQDLQWWGGTGAKSTTGGKMTPSGEKKEDGAPSGGGGGGLPGAGLLRNLNRIRKSKLGRKALATLGRSKIGQSVRKFARPATSLLRKGGKLIKSGPGRKAIQRVLSTGGRKIVNTVGRKAAGKVAGKFLGKSLAKKIPFVGIGAGLLFAGQRALSGDFKGAALEALSGLAGTIPVPGLGTAISVGIDATLAARDMGVLPDQKKAEEGYNALANPDPSVDSLGRPIILNPSTMKAWKKAVNAAAKDGVNLPEAVTSSYRSPEQQQALVDAAQAGDPNAINPAQPGNSPHGQGWALDMKFGTKASAWMRRKGKKYGFQWQGKDDPVHFDFINGEDNDKWLRPGKNKWIPNIDPAETEKSSSGNIKTASGTGDAIKPPSGSGAKDTLNEEPVTQGNKNATGVEVSTPQIVPSPPQKEIVYVNVPSGLNKREKIAWFRNQMSVVDPHGKGNVQLVSVL